MRSHRRLRIRNVFFQRHQITMAARQKRICRMPLLGRQRKYVLHSSSAYLHSLRTSYGQRSSSTSLRNRAIACARKHCTWNILNRRGNNTCFWSCSLRARSGGFGRDFRPGQGAAAFWTGRNSGTHPLRAAPVRCGCLPCPPMKRAHEIRNRRVAELLRDVLEGEMRGRE
jgi:hypothetical protein